MNAENIQNGPEIAKFVQIEFRVLLYIVKNIVFVWKKFYISYDKNVVNLPYKVKLKNFQSLWCWKSESWVSLERLRGWTRLQQNV